MPTYEYHCDACDEDFEKVLPISRHKEPQNCVNCGEGPAQKRVVESSFVLKGDGWAGKNNRVNNQMRKKNQRLDKKQADKKRELGVKLAPNVGGERVETWSDAAKLAKSQGKDSSGYEKRAASE